MFNTRYFNIKVGLADSDKGKFNLFITRGQPQWQDGNSGVLSTIDRVAHPLSGRVRKRKE